jgi:hypothetical protein
LNNTWKNGNNDDAEYEKGQVVFHYWHVAEVKSAEYEKTDPEDAAERAVGHEARVNHTTDTGHEGRKSANDR